MRTHEFTLLVEGMDLQSDAAQDALFEAGCDDATIGVIAGVQHLHFDREARSLAEALVSAITAVEQAVPGVRVVRVAPDEYVTLAEIASAQAAPARVSGCLLPATVAWATFRHPPPELSSATNSGAGPKSRGGSPADSARPFPVRPTRRCRRSTACCKLVVRSCSWMPLIETRSWHCSRPSPAGCWSSPRRLEQRKLRLETLMLPPELHEPFVSAEARSHAALQLLERYQLLEELQRLAALPSDQWPQEQIERLPSSTAGHQEHPKLRLGRWEALFADELWQVRDARKAAAHGHLSDVELRTAVYLAGRLLAAAYGRSLHEADPV